MKATGIVRRIDDLGRVVVPKEIRRTLGIREGTPLEIFTGKDGEVILKKYSPLGEIYTFAQNYAESLSQASGVLTCITDMEKVIAASGAGKKDVVDQEISEEFVGLLEERRMVQKGVREKGMVPLLKYKNLDYLESLVCPVLTGGDVIGAVVFCGRKRRREHPRKSVRSLPSVLPHFSEVRWKHSHKAQARIIQ